MYDYRFKLSSEDRETTEKMLLTLLANSDNEIQEFTYLECHTIVTAVLKTDCSGRFTWRNLIFLMESKVLTEIICHGTTSENEKVNIIILLIMPLLKLIKI